MAQGLSAESRKKCVNIVGLKLKPSLFFLSFFLLITPFESQTECQLISSCVALMRQPGRGDIYIRR